MPEHEGHAARAVYDHEVEDPRLTGRRRAVADWGVGEELFDRMPRRRFRPSETGRRDVHRSGRFEPAEPPAVEPPILESPAFESPVAESSGLEPSAVESPAVESPVAESSGLEPSAVESPAVESPRTIDPVPDAPVGRRTVVIRGHGAEPAWTPRRSRPPRTVGERLGPRPDRLAAWAVALGMLLILIAVLTAHG